MHVFICLAVILLVASIMDFKLRRIPDWLTLPAMTAGLAYHFRTSGSQGLLFSIEGLLLGFVLLALFCLAGGMDEGDVKLLAAVGAFLGPAGVFWACFCTGLLGGMCALLLIVLSRYGKKAYTGCIDRARVFIRTRDITDLRPDRTKETPVLRYGIVITIGTFLSLLRGTCLT